MNVTQALSISINYVRSKIEYFDPLPPSTDYNVIATIYMSQITLFTAFDLPPSVLNIRTIWIVPSKKFNAGSDFGGQLIPRNLIRFQHVIVFPIPQIRELLTLLVIQ